MVADPADMWQSMTWSLGGLVGGLVGPAGRKDSRQPGRLLLVRLGSSFEAAAAAAASTNLQSCFPSCCCSAAGWIIFYILILIQQQYKNAFLTKLMYCKLTLFRMRVIQMAAAVTVAEIRPWDPGLQSPQKHTHFCCCCCPRSRTFCVTTSTFLTFCISRTLIALFWPFGWRKVIWGGGALWEVKGSARRGKSGGTEESNQINIIIPMAHRSLCHTHKIFYFYDDIIQNRGK